MYMLSGSVKKYRPVTFYPLHEKTLSFTILIPARKCILEVSFFSIYENTYYNQSLKILDKILLKNNSLVGKEFANGPRDLGSITVHVIPKTLKMVVDTSLLKTQQYKVRIEEKVEQSRERSCDLLYTSV